VCSALFRATKNYPEITTSFQDILRDINENDFAQWQDATVEIPI